MDYNFLIPYVILGLVAYIVLDKFGILGKKDKLLEEREKQSKAGYGKELNEQISKDFHFRLLKLRKNDCLLPFFFGKKVMVGVVNVGMLKKIYRFENFYVLLVKNDVLNIFEKQNDIYVVKQEEVSHQDKKFFAIKDSDILNINGVFTTTHNLKEKNEFLKAIINQTILEENLGRIYKMSSDIIFYDLKFSEQQKIEETREKVLQEMRKERLPNSILP